ncbi:hypothetical protein BTE77_24685 [Ensifer adhaerens]|nr:hypothetical protein BTE77_24685 [Ensifer adhaerens]
MKRILVTLVAMIAPIAMAEAHAEPLSSALAKAYHNNPTLNAARAGVRASAYDIDIARSAMHPKITWRSGIGYNSSAATNRGTFGIVLDQTLFDGLQTTNNVEVNKARQRAAEENTRKHRAEHPVRGDRGIYGRGADAPHRRATQTGSGFPQGAHAIRDRPPPSRRTDPNKHRSGRGAPRCGAGGTEPRPCRSEACPSDLQAGHRRRTGQINRWKSSRENAARQHR